MKKTLIASLTLLTAFGGHAVFAKSDAPQSTVASAPCNIAIATVYAGINKSGSRVTMAAGAHGDSTGQAWSITATDAGVTVVSQGFPEATSDWQILASFVSPKGSRTLHVVAQTADGSVVCTQDLTYKV